MTEQSVSDAVGIKYDQQGNAYKWSAGGWRPYEDRGTLENMMIGAGQTFTELGRGAQQLFGSDEAQAEAKRLQDGEREIQGYLDEDAPIAANVGRALPFAATAPLSGGSIPGMLGVTALDAGIAGLQYADTPGERATNMLFGAGGAAGGFAVGAMANRVMNNINRSSKMMAQTVPPSGAVPSRTGTSVGAAEVDGMRVGTAGQKLRGDARHIFDEANRQVGGQGIDNPADLQAMLDLREAGYMLPPGAASGNKGERALFDFAQRFQSTRQMVEDMVGGPNQETLKRQVLRAMGDSGADKRVPTFDTATVSRMVAQTEDMIGDIMQTAKKIEVGDDIGKSMRSTIEGYESNHRFIGKGEDPVVRRLENIEQQILDPGVSGEDLRRLRGDLRNDMSKNISSGEERALQQMIDDIDQTISEALQRNNSPYSIEDFKKGMLQHRLAIALDKGAGAVKEGNVQPGALNRALKSVFKAEYRNDRKIFEESGRFTEAGPEAAEHFESLFKSVQGLERFKNIVNDSGTAQGLQLMDVLGEASVTGAPVATGGAALARIALPKMIRNSQYTPQQLREMLETVQAMQ